MSFWTLTLLFNLKSFSQTDLYRLKEAINSVDSSWTIRIDTIEKFNHIERAVGTLTLSKDTINVKYYICEDIDKSVEKSIYYYHLSTSIIVPKNDNYFKTLHFDKYVLFLPIDYSWITKNNESTKLIGKLLEKLK